MKKILQADKTNLYYFIIIVLLLCIPIVSCGPTRLEYEALQKGPGHETDSTYTTENAKIIYNSGHKYLQKFKSQM